MKRILTLMVAVLLLFSTSLAEESATTAEMPQEYYDQAVRESLYWFCMALPDRAVFTKSEDAWYATQTEMNPYNLSLDFVFDEDGLLTCIHAFTPNRNTKTDEAAARTPLEHQHEFSRYFSAFVNGEARDGLEWLDCAMSIFSDESGTPHTLMTLVQRRNADALPDVLARIYWLNNPGALDSIQLHYLQP